MTDQDQNRCMDCKAPLTIKNRYPVYSSHLAVIGYRCADCREKNKSPEAKKREEEISRLTKDVPRQENIKHNLLKTLENK
ncbi:MAG: hypothetical protein OIN66_13220 [Candidatus Methanoperedens sp.]|nr:hypothetical protein [Candidatus Methanoperedens sp.]